MASESAPRFREARPADASAVGLLHAESWRRHYRGAYSDAFLDGDVVADRLEVWSRRLARPDAARRTILAEQDGVLVGFVNVALDADARWGALVDNLHVMHDRQDQGIGARLMGLGGAAVRAASQHGGVYLWVLEQNVAAQGFYGALGGVEVERAPVDPPGGVAARLAGAVTKLRYAWPDVAALIDSVQRLS